MNVDRDIRTGFVGLLLATIASVGLMAFIGRPVPRPVVGKSNLVPTISPSLAHLAVGSVVQLRSGSGGSLLVAEQADAELRLRGSVAEVNVGPDRVAAEALLSIPLSLNWHHPQLGLPAAQIIRVAELDHDGRSGPVRMTTLVFADHGRLPVLSIYAPAGALFDPDTGIMVVGNGIYHAPEKVLTAEYRDPKWWKYPGNFHMRGKEWEREGRMQLIAADGTEMLQTDVGLRINGQMTRSFPQHALRLGFKDPVHLNVFGEEAKNGYDGLVLRTAGNDQIKAMLRDPFMHGLIAGLPIEVAAALTCVTYINGAYWGVHHLRHRLDEKEIARRYDIPKKKITILEDEARLYRGDTMEVVYFERLSNRTFKWDGKDTVVRRALEENLDVDGFFNYMATQMIIGNVDWPSQNVKFWKYNGTERGDAPRDGKWRFIMGDCDLAYGVHSSASTDMFTRVNALDVPLTRLFHGMMRAPDLRARFIAKARELATGQFSTSRSMEHLDALVALMAPEMGRHTARWGRPGSVAAWQREVDVLREFAKEREGQVLKQLETFERR